MVSASLWPQPGHTIDDFSMISLFMPYPVWINARGNGYSAVKASLKKTGLPGFAYC
jgi:hypothetical protein